MRSMDIGIFREIWQNVLQRYKQTSPPHLQKIAYQVEMHRTDIASCTYRKPDKIPAIYFRLRSYRFTMFLHYDYRRSSL
jgi:hypothetical protein